MKRTTKIVPGFDCRDKCPHKPKGNHGIHCDDWWYVVVADSGDRALSLCVFSGRYPASVKSAPAEMRRACGAGMDYHSARRTKSGYRRTKCEWLGGRACWADGSGIQADELWKLHGDPAQPEQGEEFWLALEEKARQWFVRLDDEAAEVQP